MPLPRESSRRDRFTCLVCERRNADAGYMAWNASIGISDWVFLCRVCRATAFRTDRDERVFPEWLPAFNAVPKGVPVLG